MKCPKCGTELDVWHVAEGGEEFIDRRELREREPRGSEQTARDET